MHNAEILAQLEHHHLFASLTLEQKKQLFMNSHVQYYREDTIVFQKDEIATMFFFVLEGAVRLYFSAPDGREKNVRIFEKGDSFAEALMFMKRDTYPANAMTVMPSKILAINSDFYRKMILQNTDLAISLLGKCCEHIYMLSQQIEMLGVLDARGRLIRYLRQQLPVGAQDGHHLYISISKKDLAQYLAIRPETLSRLIRQLEREDIIQWHQHDCIVIRSVAYLQEHKLN